MPRFHAAWSGGSILGATIGVPVNALDVPLVAHLGAVGVLSAAAAWWASTGFLPAHPEHGGPSGLSAWREPRTLAIGLMVLAFALTEGVANDWLALALIDGYGVPDWLGVAGFAAVRDLHDDRPAGRHRPARPVRPGAGAAGHGARQRWSACCSSCTATTRCSSSSA